MLDIVLPGGAGNLISVGYRVALARETFAPFDGIETYLLGRINPRFWRGLYLLRV